MSDETWPRSVYRWMDGDWTFVVDLSTASQPVSDLALHARLGSAPGECLKIESVHVP